MLTERIELLAQAVGSDVKNLLTKLGPLENLETGVRTDLVAAINEIITLAGTGRKTLDPVRKAAGIVLSQDLLSADFTSGAQGVVMGNRELPPGKWYFEVQFVAGTNSGNASVGLCSRDEPLTNQVGYSASDNAVGVFQNSGRVYLGSTDFVATVSNFATVGQAIGCAYDSATRQVWFVGSSGNWNGSPTANPSTGVEGIVVPGNERLVMAICTDSLATFRANFGLPQGFMMTLPQGFSPLYDFGGQLAEDIQQVAGELIVFTQALQQATADLQGLSSDVEGKLDAHGGTAQGLKYKVANLGNTSGNRQINLSEAQEFTMNITGNTTFSFTNAPGAGESQVVYLRLQNAGSRTINWPTSTSFEEGSAPELTESGTDILGVKYDTATSTYMVFMLGRDVK